MLCGSSVVFMFVLKVLVWIGVPWQPTSCRQTQWLRCWKTMGLRRWSCLMQSSLQWALWLGLISRSWSLFPTISWRWWTAIVVLSNGSRETSPAICSMEELTSSISIFLFFLFNYSFSDWFIIINFHGILNFINYGHSPYIYWKLLIIFCFNLKIFWDILCFIYFKIQDLFWSHWYEVLGNLCYFGMLIGWITWVGSWLCHGQLGHVRFHIITWHSMPCLWIFCSIAF